MNLYVISIWLNYKILIYLYIYQNCTKKIEYFEMSSHFIVRRVWKGGRVNVKQDVWRENEKALSSDYSLLGFGMK